MSDKDRFVLELSRQEAEHLHEALYALGEHVAAGAAIPSFDGQFDRDVGRVLRDLNIYLGRGPRLA